MVSLKEWSDSEPSKSHRQNLRGGGRPGRPWAPFARLRKASGSVPETRQQRGLKFRAFITSVASIKVRHLERCHWHPKHKSHQPCGHHHHHRPITMKISKTPWTNRDIDESGALFLVVPAREADVPKPGCTQENDFPRRADGHREGWTGRGQTICVN